MRILYILEFLPTYLARELAGLSSREVELDVILIGRQKIARTWQRVLASEGEDSICSRTREISTNWMEGPKSELLIPAVKLVAKMLVRRPLTAVKLLFRSFLDGETRYFLMALEVTGKSLKPDLIHSHFVKRAARVAMWASRIMDVPFTVTAHAKDIFVPWDIGALRRVLEAAGTVYTISRFSRRFLGDLLGERILDKIMVTYLGLDPGQLPERSAPPERPEIVSVASGLVPRKGVNFLLDACRLLREEGLKFRCTIIGSDNHGVLLEDYRRSVMQGDLEGVVRFPGLLDSREVLRRVAEASIFVLPSVRAANGDMDGIPVALMEAMAIGVPVVSTRISGIPELIEDRRDGLLAIPGDAADLARIIEFMLTNSEDAAVMASQAKDKMSRQFSLDRYAGQIIDCWSQLIEGGVSS